jgi:hypothetical protein
VANRIKMTIDKATAHYIEQLIGAARDQIKHFEQKLDGNG